MKGKWLKIGAGIVLALTATALAGLWWYGDSPRLAWRLELIRLKTVGALADETWPMVIRRVKPSSQPSPEPQGFEAIRIENVLDSPSDLKAGELLFQSHCTQCHAAGGKDSLAPDLASESFQQRAEDTDIYFAIARGVPGTSMPGFGGSTVETLQLVAFVRDLANRADESALESEPERPGKVCAPCESIDVTHERLRNAINDPQNWLTYSGSYTGQRFSSLQQINRQTISRLRPRWAYQMKSLEGVQSVPLVADGVMFLTGPENEVIALDAGTGEPFWVFDRVVPNSVPVCCGRKNRGVAILGNRVYHGALDGRLIALDMATGQPVWDVEVANPKEGFSLTGAPLAVKDKIIVGVAGGDLGVRGFLDAYDAETGDRVWRFYTIAGPGEPGHETWENDAWKTGGGATWITGSYDPELNLLYWGVGNPAPDLDGDYRPGDNFYTCSVIALDPDTGELKWHYQFSPHDTNDWDAALVPVLADLEYSGEPRKLMLWANRNCFFYLLDRETGEFLQATEYCKQNWNDGFTEEGRPIRRPEASPSEEGATILPATVGGSNWWLPAYSPRTQFYYVTYLLYDEIQYRSDGEFVPGKMFRRGWTRSAPGGRHISGVRAINAKTGDVVWDMFPEGERSRSGILATESDLVFTGSTSGVLYGLDASTGQELWRLRLGGPIDMGPITYLHEGKQQLAVISTGVLVVLDLPDEVE